MRLQGRPGLGGKPRASAERAPPMPVAGARHALMGQFDYADTWLNMADALASRGNTQDAVNLLRTQVARRPNDYKLWVGLGNALSDHSRTLSPAARFAYARAASSRLATRRRPSSSGWRKRARATPRRPCACGARYWPTRRPMPAGGRWSKMAFC